MVIRRPFRQASAAIIAVLGLCLAGCSSGSEGGGGDATSETGGGSGGGSGEEETGGGSGGGSGEERGASWQVETVESGGWGLHVDVATPDGGPVSIAYFSSDSFEDGPCDEVGDSPPDRLRWRMHVARKQGSEWSIETVAEPPYVGTPPGLDLEATPDGGLALAGMTGDPLPMFDYCGVNDAALYKRQSKGEWTTETLATSSGDVTGTDKSGADFGEVVGFWPSLAYDSSGRPAVTFKDVHAGGRQADDFKIASLEMARGGGDGWSLSSVDWYRGAGDHGELTFDAEGRPVVAYNVPNQDAGIWVSRVPDGGGEPKRVRLHSNPGSKRPAIAVDPESGTLHVLFYNAERGFPELATLEKGDPIERLDEGWSFTEKGIGNSRYDEGYAPSMAFGPRGLLHVLYFRCTVASGGLGDCRATEDGLVHAWRDGDIWEREVVDEGGESGLCGESPALGFDADGDPVAAYRCEELVDGELQATVKFAVKQ